MKICSILPWGHCGSTTLAASEASRGVHRADNADTEVSEASVPLSLAVRKPDPAQVREIAGRLDALLDSEDEYTEEDLLFMDQADLRTMSSWGMTMYGEGMSSYYDLGSIDDTYPDFPVLLSEIRHMRDGLDKLPGKHPRDWENSLLNTAKTDEMKKPSRMRMFV